MAGSSPAMTHLVRRDMFSEKMAAVVLLLIAALSMSACSSDQAPRYPAARRPIGAREPLQPGHWRGQVGNTLVDYTIEQVSPTTVLVRVSGTVLRQANRSYDTSSTENYFYDRPRTCKRVNDGRSFDCTRYTDMHIDNGLLCGVYEAPDQVYRPCLDPVP
jgi:hypothetical protein